MATILWLGFLLHAAIGSDAGLMPVGIIGLMFILLWRYGTAAGVLRSASFAAALPALLAVMQTTPITISKPQHQDGRSGRLRPPLQPCHRKAGSGRCNRRLVYHL